MHRILVADDDRDFRDALERALQKAGFQVFLADGGREAIALMRDSNTRPDLILLDLFMPAVDGWDVIQCVARDPALQSIPIVVMTSLRKEDVAAEPAGSFLRKPFTIAELLASIHEKLGHRSASA